MICTSSLELGIDIGFLDYVIQYNSPRQVSRLIQSVGRSGHKIGKTSKGLVITQDSDDTLEAIVLCRRSLLGQLEPMVPFKNANDAAIHQIAGLLVETASWRLEDMYTLIRSAYPYSTLSLESLKNILAYMRDRYPKLLHFAENDNIVKRARDFKPLFDYYFENLSMIPDEKQYIVIGEGDRPVGVLDEAFVSEYGQVGVKFVEAGRCWKILEIYENKVYVGARRGPHGGRAELGGRRDTRTDGRRARGRRHSEGVRRAPLRLAGGGVRGAAVQEVSDRHPRRVRVREGGPGAAHDGAPGPLGQAGHHREVGQVRDNPGLVRAQGQQGPGEGRRPRISERLGQSVVVHQDPYRIILEVDASRSWCATPCWGWSTRTWGSSQG